ncbi:glycoside hydrolase family 2 TIM barrel-domain containing protein [Glaciecola siphonariae]|uniref:Glycoside hydrolase family 2 TIM barrel-domain containing protein n=1 Tax=Glaciecola siphonariae TaxID=521012 RepID=A0ABV9LWI4_9ALTE
MRKRSYICDFLTATVLFVGVCISANAVQHQTVNINSDWLYLEQNAANLEELAAAGDKGWQSIHLPHTWNAVDTLDAAPGYRRSASWYSKALSPEQINKNGKTILYFEGANYETQVFVNNTFVGEHIGGYIGFRFDISEFLVPSGNNTLLVRVSNRFNPNLIPSQKSDFFLFGGITRDVWLEHVPQTYIKRIVAKTPVVNAQSAETLAEFEIHAHENSAAQLRVEVKDPDGQTVLTELADIRLEKGTNKTAVELPSLAEPSLWSPDTPALYTLHLSLNKNNETVHRDSEVFGYRWFEMRPHEGFFLNGERLLIRGTHRHEEHAGVGAAVSNEQHYKDMQMIKDMGANFVRLGHYPQDPEVYRAANELGLLIWDELPWCRGGKGGEEWERNTEHSLNAMIKQNINHPSIIFWSLGNEIYWEEDFVGGGDESVINPYLKKLNDMTKALDPYRLTTIRKYYPGWDIVDAFSPSIWAGWYGGSYDQYEEALTKAMAQYPAFLHMEYGGSSHVGRHTETPVTPSGLMGAQVSVEEAVNQAVVRSVAKDTDWNESYIVDLFDWHLNVSENLEGFAGNAQWAFKDFGTPLRPENPLPYMNQKGLVDREGNKKDAYYVFASYWSKTPFCWIESDTWTHRNGPKEGRDVTVYCNTEEAELFLNDKSLGKKAKQAGVVPAGGLVWQVPFKEGENALKVVGFNNNKEIANDTRNVTYLVGKHGKYDHIKLIASPLGDDRYLIEAEARDKNGNRVLNYQERVHFYNIGDEGTLLENYGTPHKSSTIEMGSGYAAIEFVAGDKPSTVEFRTQNVKGVYVDIPAAKVGSEQGGAGK